MRKARYRPKARADIGAALKLSRHRFGARAMNDYKALIDNAVALLCETPNRTNVQRREDLTNAPSFFHLRHARMRGAAPKHARHIIVFTYDDKTLTIIRVLHDQMNVDAQIGEATEE